MEAFGINIIWIAAYIIIFGIFTFFAKGFIKKVLDTVEERKTAIEEGLKNADDAQILKTKALQESELEREKLVQNAYQDAQKILEAAKAKEAKILDEAKVKANVIVSEAVKDIEALKETSKNEGLQEAKDIIALAVKKSFEGLDLDAKSEEKLVEQSLKNLNK